MRITPAEPHDATELTPLRFMELARRRGLDGPSILAIEILGWLAVDRGLDLAALPGLSSPRTGSRRIDG